MAKPCRYCGGSGHSSTFCWLRPRKKLRMGKRPKKVGRETVKWLRYRADWFENHPPDRDGFYTCYYCHEKITRKETTLDHKLPRGSHPELKYEDTNIVPCCFRCNTNKGSVHHDKYISTLEAPQA